jgi:hypothetical protein
MLDGRVKESKVTLPGWAFVSLALVFREYPSKKDCLLSLFVPHQEQVALPGYLVEDTPEGTLWVPTPEVRRVVDVPHGDDTEVFKKIIGNKPGVLKYVVSTPYGLASVKHPKDKHCTPFISAAWLEERYGLQASMANMNIPVAFGPHPPNKGTTGPPKASKAPGVINPKQSSVKVTLSCRLVDKRAGSSRESSTT